MNSSLRSVICSITLSLSVIGLPAPACLAAPEPSDARPLVFGAALHLTGDYGPIGDAFRRGIELGLDEVRAQGGVSGRPVKVIFDDTAYDMGRTQTIVQRFISVDQVEAILVSNYTEVMRVGPAVERAQTPTVTIWDSSPEIEQLGRYVFGLGVWTPDSAQRVARYAAAQLKAKRAIIVATEGEWALKAKEYFSAEFKAQGGEVMRAVTVLPQETDFRTILTKIRAQKPDVVYAPIADNIVAFFSQYSAARVGAPVITSDVLTEELVAALGARADGIVQAQGGDATGALRAHLMERYRARFGEECRMPLFVALGYDALRVLVEAARRAAHADRASITEQLYTIHSLPGAAAEITISPEGSSRLPTTLMRVQGGRLEPMR